MGGCLVVLSQDGPTFFPLHSRCWAYFSKVQQGTELKILSGERTTRSEGHQPISQMRKTEAQRAEGLP